MQKKYAFLFPGQGAQAPGMIKDIAEHFSSANDVLEQVSSIIQSDIKKLLWESSQEELNRSDNSQIAITAASIAKERGIEPSAAMGFSLGEFPALYAAGVLSFTDVITVVRERGRIMQSVCEEIARENAGNAPGMSAILGLAPQKVKDIVSTIPNAYAANMNSEKQTVISGTAEALSAAEKALTEAGAKRAIRLKVAGPFHSPLMQKAAASFEKVLEGTTFSQPKIPLFSNVSGARATSAQEIKENALLHLTHPVQWTSEEKVLEQTIKESGDEWQVLEVGPGKVLTGLWGQTEFGATLPSLPVNTTETLENL